MKFQSLALGLALASAAQASNASMSLVSHPANLGAHADPLAIPISQVPVWANYNYGVHEHVGSPRPFPAGVLVSRHGVEMNLNLTNAFGIELVPVDPTQVPGMPLTLRVIEGRGLPPGSPYTREQVLAATLWCLLLDVAGSEEQPVVVSVDAQEPALQSYTGDYVRSRDGLDLVHGEIAGSRLERDARGVVWVVFDPEKHQPRVVEKPPGEAPPLVFIPLMLGGGAVGDESFVLVPHWLGPDSAVLQAPWAAIPRAMNMFSAKSGENANPLHGSNLQASNVGARNRTVMIHGGWQADEGNGHEEDRRMLAVAIHATLASGMPTKEDPITILLSTDSMPENASDFLADDGWERDDRRRWRLTFDAAPEHVVGYQLEPWLAGGFIVVAQP